MFGVIGKDNRKNTTALRQHKRQKVATHANRQKMESALTALSPNFLVSWSYSASVKGWMDCCCTLIVNRGYTYTQKEKIH